MENKLLIINYLSKMKISKLLLIFFVALVYSCAGRGGGNNNAESSNDNLSLSSDSEEVLKASVTGWFNGTIEGKVADGVNLNGVRAFITSYQSEYVILASSRVVDGRFTLELPELKDDMLFAWNHADIFSVTRWDVNVNPPELMMRSLSFCDFNNQPVLIEIPGCELFVSFVYADRDAVVTSGTSRTIKYDLQLKKGWNVVVRKDRRASQAFENNVYYESEPMPDNAVWRKI